MPRSLGPLSYCLGVGLALGCNEAARGVGDEGATGGSASAASASATESAGSGAESQTAATGSASDSADSGGGEGEADTSGATDGVRFDVESPTTSAGLTGGGGTCHVVEGGDAVPDCRTSGPPDAFDARVQWQWDGDGERIRVLPLVANMTDDNGDGSVDLCDVPDVLVLSSPDAAGSFGSGVLHLFSGDDGTLHWKSVVELSRSISPALGDIDDDGLVEIVAVSQGGTIVALEHDGTLKWDSGERRPGGVEDAALGLADLDADGDVEVYGYGHILDHMGSNLFSIPYTSGGISTTRTATAPVAADLDGDGDMEVVIGHKAFHHDGSVYYDHGFALDRGFPQVANLDSDPLPEVLVTNQEGIALLEHDGTIVYQDRRPTGDEATGTNWVRPATVHDFDGDGVAEFALSSRNHYALYRPDASVVWQSDILDLSGIAAGTAFDFLGDGTAEAMYADESTFFVFGEVGDVLLSVPRSSTTYIEYPVVADVDNDGAAEAVIVSEDPPAPRLQVVSDAQERWIQARRIWNQHTYHVTNVREDGTIPQQEPRHWERLNTFRTNAQIENGGVCRPPPVG